MAAATADIVTAQHPAVHLNDVLDLTREPVGAGAAWKPVKCDGPMDSLSVGNGEGANGGARQEKSGAKRAPQDYVLRHSRSAAFVAGIKALV